VLRLLKYKKKKLGQWLRVGLSFAAFALLFFLIPLLVKAVIAAFKEVFTI